NRIHSWHLYSIRLRPSVRGMDRALAISELKEAGIGASVHWMPLHLHQYYRKALGYKPADCPCAASIYPQLISLPLYPDLTAEDIERVCSTLKEIIAAPSVPGADFEALAGQPA